jgi:predicted flap endonuclease-1-like 5' DNA nuclease
MQPANSVRAPAPSFPPGAEFGRTLSGIGPSAAEPDSSDPRVLELLRKVSEYEERGRALLAERDALRSEQRALLRTAEQQRETVLRLAEAARTALSERETLERELAETRAAGARTAATAREQAERRVRSGEEHAATVAALTRRVSELEEQLAARPALEKRLAELERQVSRTARLTERNTELEGLLAEAEGALAEARARPAAVESAGDDLTRLKGVGPTFERALRAAGITSFAQIALWTHRDILTIAPLLRARPERILREDWVGSAQLLLASE